MMLRHLPSLACALGLAVLVAGCTSSGSAASESASSQTNQTCSKIESDAQTISNFMTDPSHQGNQNYTYQDGLNQLQQAQAMFDKKTAIINAAAGTPLATSPTPNSLNDTMTYISSLKQQCGWKW